MKKLMAFALVAFASLGAARIALAQSHQLRGQVPFAFTAGSTQLPAGDYRITFDDPALVTFRNMDNYKSATMLVGAEQGVKDGTCKLIFAHYGDQYFLRESRCGAANANFVLPSSRREKRAVEQAAGIHNSDRIAVGMR